MRLVDLLLAPLSFTRTLWISLCFCHAYGFLSLQSRSFVYKELQELLPRVKRRILGIRCLNHRPLDLLQVEGILPSKRNSEVGLEWMNKAT